MRHVADGTLRRLADEPLAVPDRVVDHLAGCPRCATRRADIGVDAEYSRDLLTAPAPVPDPDRAWARLQARIQHGPPARTAVARSRWRPRTALVAGAAGLAVAGSVAAATVTTVFAPTHVAPVTLTQDDLQTLASVMGLDPGRSLGAFPSPSGTQKFAFGTISWSSSGPPSQVGSLHQAESLSGLSVSLPTRLPAGIGSVQRFAVQPQLRATVTFNAAAKRLAGATVTLDIPPAVVVAYGAAGTQLPGLAVLAMPRPTAVSSGASTAQIEAFLLSRPGLPRQLAEEFKLLGDPTTTLPVPVASGTTVRSVRVAGAPGVLVSVPSKAASGVVWEDTHATLHAVAGLLTPQDVLHVADQLG